MMGRRRHVIPALIVVVMLLIAVAPLPYGYYQVLRWLICGVAVFIAFEAYRWGKRWATWLFGIIAVLFNPVLPVHLSKEVWQPIDVVCALLFGMSIIFLKGPQPEISGGKRRPEQMEAGEEVSPNVIPGDKQMPEIPPSQQQRERKRARANWAIVLSVAVLVVALAGLVGWGIGYSSQKLLRFFLHPRRKQYPQ